MSWWSPFERLARHMDKTEDAGYLTPGQRAFVQMGVAVGIAASLPGWAAIADKKLGLGILDPDVIDWLPWLVVAGTGVAGISMLTAFVLVLVNASGKDR